MSGPHCPASPSLTSYTLCGMLDKLPHKVFIPAFDPIRLPLRSFSPISDRFTRLLCLLIPLALGVNTPADAVPLAPAPPPARLWLEADLAPG